MNLDPIDPSSAVSLAQSLVRVNSVNPSHDGPAGGEADVLGLCAEVLREAGVPSELRDAKPGRPNLIARIEGIKGADPDAPILFETHVDTVSAEAMTIEPWAAEIRDGRLWGRGATDAKGQVAAMVTAFCAVARAAKAGAPPPRSLELALVSDEEAGFGGVRALIENYQAQGTKPACAVVGEPTELEIVIAHKGTIRFWIDVEGRAAHSSIPVRGVNAIDHAAAIVRAIQGGYKRRLGEVRHDLLGSPTVNVSMIEGGTQVNMVPARASILIDRRTIPGETPDSIRAEFEAIFAEVREKIPDLRASQREPEMIDPSMETSPQEPIVRAACDVAGKFGRVGFGIGVPYGTDGSKLAEFGVPTIIVGPGSIEQAHVEDEWISLDALAEGTRFFHRLMTMGCGECAQ